MKEMLERIWLANPIKSYLAVLAVILFAWALRRYISRYFAGLLFRIFRHIWSGLDKQSFVRLVVKPLGFFLFLLISIIALRKLHFPDENTYTGRDWLENQLVFLLNTDLYGYSILSILHCIASIVLVISFTRLLLKIVEFIAMILEEKANLTPDQSDNQLVVFFRDFFRVIIYIIGVLMLLKFAFQFDIGNMLTGLSIIGAAVALALRESLENLIASFIIFFDKPFTLGDIVKVQNITGNVEKIGLRSTRIRTDQKTYVTVPNKQMVDSILDNYSLRTQRRGDLRLELNLSTSAAKLDALLAGAKKIITEKPIIEDANIFISDITGQAVILQSDYYSAPVTIREFNTARQEIHLDILRLMEQLGIEIAGASTDIRVEGSLSGPPRSN